MSRKNLILLIVITAVLLATGVFFLAKVILNTMVTAVYQDDFSPTATLQPAITQQSLSAQEPDEHTLDPIVSATMDTIEGQVSDLRGLSVENTIPRKVLTGDELRQIVTEDFLEEYQPEDEARDAAILNLFGLLPEGFNLKEFYMDLYSEQIAGFYDSEEKAMYVVSDTGFGAMERMTYAHEFVHVLQDKQFQFEDQLDYSEDSCEEDSERCIAIQALIEGDAMLTEQLWFQTHGTQNDLQEIQEFYTSYQSPVYDSAPEYMKEDFNFPYLYGTSFVQALYAQGGYDAVNAAFTDVNPLSTEQILHPTAYPDDVPQNPGLPDLSEVLGDDWSLIDENVIGEWYIYLILAKGENSKSRLHDGIAQDAAEGWGGDRYVIFENKGTGGLAAVISFVWDTPQDATKAFEAFSTYSDLRFGSSIEAGLWQDAGLFSSLEQIDETNFVWVMAPEKTLLESLQNAVGN